MDRIRVFLRRLPPMTLSLLTAGAILWLTLAPKPLGEEPPRLFEGADKIAHAIMFGGLAMMMLLDWQRRNGWLPVTFPRAFLVALISSAFGGIIEISQAEMGLGRGFEWGDIVADTLGAFIFSGCWMWWQKYWVITNR